jgi:hypothetical protein
MAETARTISRREILVLISGHPALPKELFAGCPQGAEPKSDDAVKVAAFITALLGNVQIPDPVLSQTASNFALRLGRLFRKWCSDPQQLSESYHPGQWFELIKENWAYSERDAWRAPDGFRPSKSQRTISTEAIGERNPADLRSFERETDIKDAILMLRKKWNQPILMVELIHFGGLTLAHAAKVIGVSAPTAKKQLQKELRELARIFRP